MSMEYLSTDGALCNLLPKQTEHKETETKPESGAEGMQVWKSQPISNPRQSPGALRCVCPLMNETANGSNCD